MKIKTLSSIRSKWLIHFIGSRPVMLLLLFGHLGCFLLICFKHSPGLQSWAAIPLINGLVTLWLLAKSQTQFLSWNV